MTPDEVEAILSEVERRLTETGLVDPRSFRRVVAAVRGDPRLVARFADRLAVVDLVAFRTWARIVVPLPVGTTLAVVGAVVGLAIAWAAFVVAAPWNGIAVLVAAGVLVVATHSLAHLVVGRLVGIRFVAWFVGRRRPQPGIKVDLASYLNTPPRARAWMHASGALVTKAVPFLLLPVALVVDAPAWSTVLLVVLGVGQILTDVFFSVRSSDWARFRRELRHARSSS